MPPRELLLPPELRYAYGEKFNLPAVAVDAVEEEELLDDGIDDEDDEDDGAA